MDKPKGRTDTDPWFNRWLELMEQAHYALDREPFRKLEDRITNEITFHRKWPNGIDSIKLPAGRRS